jgi:hypothetical protein
MKKREAREERAVVNLLPPTVSTPVHLPDYLTTVVSAYFFKTVTTFVALATSVAGEHHACLSAYRHILSRR